METEYKLKLAPSLQEHHDLLKSDFRPKSFYDQMTKGMIYNEMELTRQRNKLLMVKIEKLELEKRNLIDLNSDQCHEDQMYKLKIENLERALSKAKQVDEKSKIEQINCVKCESVISQVIKAQNKEKSLIQEIENLKQNMDLQNEKYEALKTHTKKLDDSLRDSQVQNSSKDENIDLNPVSFLKSIEMLRLGSIIKNLKKEADSSNDQVNSLKETIRTLREELLASKDSSKMENTLNGDRIHQNLMNLPPSIQESVRHSLQSPGFDTVLRNLIRKDQTGGDISSIYQRNHEDENLIKKLKTEIQKLQIHELENETKRIDIDDMKRVVKNLFRSFRNCSELDTESVKDQILQNHIFKSVYLNSQFPQKSAEINKSHSSSLLSIILKQLLAKLENLFDVNLPFCDHVSEQLSKFKTQNLNVGVWDISGIAHDMLLKIHRTFLDGLDDFKEQFVSLVNDKKVSRRVPKIEVPNPKELKQPVIKNLMVKNFSSVGTNGASMGKSSITNENETPFTERDNRGKKSNGKNGKRLNIEESEILKCLDQQKSIYFDNCSSKKMSKKGSEVYIKIDKAIKSSKNSGIVTYTSSSILPKENKTNSSKMVSFGKESDTIESKNNSVTFQIEGNHPDYQPRDTTGTGGSPNTIDQNSINFKTRSNNMEFATGCEDFECSYMVSDIQDSNFPQDYMTNPSNNHKIESKFDILNLEKNELNIVKTLDTQQTDQSPSVYIRELGSDDHKYDTNVDNFNSLDFKKSETNPFDDSKIPFATREIVQDTSYVEFVDRSSVGKNTLFNNTLNTKNMDVNVMTRRTLNLMENDLMSEGFSTLQTQKSISSPVQQGFKNIPNLGSKVQQFSNSPVLNINTMGLLKPENQLTINLNKVEGQVIGESEFGDDNTDMAYQNRVLVDPIYSQMNLPAMPHVQLHTPSGQTYNRNMNPHEMVRHNPQTNAINTHSLGYEQHLVPQNQVNNFQYQQQQTHGGINLLQAEAQHHQHQQQIYQQQQQQLKQQWINQQQQHNQNIQNYSLEYNSGSMDSKYGTIQNQSIGSVNVQQLNTMPVVNLHVSSPKRQNLSQRKRTNNSSWRKKPKLRNC